MKIHIDTDDISTRTVAKWLLFIAVLILAYHLGYWCAMHKMQRYHGYGSKCAYGNYFDREIPQMSDRFNMRAMHEQMMSGGDLIYGYGTAAAGPIMMRAGGISASASPEEGRRVIFYRNQ